MGARDRAGGTLARFATMRKRKAGSLWRIVYSVTDGAIIELHDETQQTYRAACVRDERLQACVYLTAGTGALPGLDWLKRQLGEAKLDKRARKALLAGRAPDGRPVLEALTAVIGLTELVALNHGAHGAIEDENAFLE